MIIKKFIKLAIWKPIDKFLKKNWYLALVLEFLNGFPKKELTRYFESLLWKLDSTIIF